MAALLFVKGPVDGGVLIQSSALVGNLSVFEYDYVMQTANLGNRQSVSANFSATSLSVLGNKVPTNND
jgi:hypothetical protein